MAITEHNDAQIYHSPCGERRLLPRLRRRLQGISIHAPRMGSDNGGGNRYLHTKISIHAPRVGSDQVRSVRRSLPRLISIHAPRVGSDLTVPGLFPKWEPFQSTLPVWGATARHRVGKYVRKPISIHAPRVGSDLRGGYLPPCIFYFNPRSPCGERLYA